MSIATSITSFTNEQLSQCQRDGFVFLRGVFQSEEVREFQKEAERLLASDLVHENNLRTRPKKLASGALEVERFDPVIDVSSLFARLVRDERILAPLQAVFGEDAVLFKDKLIFKVPGMKGYSMHQDYAWWQPQPKGEEVLPNVTPGKILSVMIGIDAADAENGAVQLFPGMHHELLSTPGQLRNLLPDEIAKIDLNTSVLGETVPGDVVIFHSLTPHCSNMNNSNRSRRQLYLSYNAASAGDVYQAQQSHYRRYAPKASTGKLFFR